MGILTLHTDEPVNEIDILHLDKSTIEGYYYGLNPTDIKKQFIRYNKKAWG